jgi:hypothetical protein
MLRLRPFLPVLRPRLAARRSVILDSLTAAAHPDAVVSGVLLAVVGSLLAVGLTGLLGPVVSLDLFSPDLGLGDLLRFVVEIVVSAVALIAAGLGLARHPRFPAVFMAVAASLTVLISFSLFQRLLAGATITGLPLFTLLGIPVVLAVPYVVFSRRCRLIFRQRLNMNDLRDLTGPEPWPQSSSDLAMEALLPAINDGAPGAAPRRSRPRRIGPTAEAGASVATRGAQGIRATAPPAPDAPNAALWAALYGTPAGAMSGPAEEPAEAGNGPQGGTGKRVGLEALINLRPPGS